MTKFCLTELPENKLKYDVQGLPNEIVLAILTAMTEQPQVTVLILSAVSMWASRDEKNATHLQQIVKQVPM